MADCYPTGCPPCTEEISFPENPINGQRECFMIGKDPNTNEDILKCWVYDQCIPGWRAEGPAVAPINFKGQLDLTKTETENGITVKEAGDYYIVAVASQTQQFLANNWVDLQHEVSVGAFVLWSGTEWVEVPRPCGEQADCALDTTPNPDNREYGVVQIASVEEVQAGTDKCKPVTPYTLQKKIDSDLPKVDTDTCPVTVDAEGPEAVAFVNQRNNISCKTLTEGTTNFFGVGQIATNYSNDRDTYGDGWDTDWLTNAALAPIIDGIIRRIEEIEQGGGGQPVASVVRTFNSSGTWTPVDAANLTAIKVVLAGGAGGAGHPYPVAVAGGIFNSPYPGRDSKFFEKDLTVAESGTSAAIVVGSGGSGASFFTGNAAQTCNTAGGDSSFTGNGTETVIIVGGSGNSGSASQVPGTTDCNPVTDRANTNIDTDVTSLFPARLGGKTYTVGVNPDPEDNDVNVNGASGAKGLVLVYEYYPSDWVDPRSGGFNL